MFEMNSVCSGMVVPEKKRRAKAGKRPKNRRSSESESDDFSHVKRIKVEEVTSQLVSSSSQASWFETIHCI